MVGHTTLIRGSDIRTGVTIIDPGVKDLFRNKLPAAIYVGNGFGKLAGITQVEELGTLEAPLALTNTLAVGVVVRGLVDLTIAHTPDLKPYETVNVVVGETNDGMLNAIHKDVVIAKDVFDAYDARSSDVKVGNVGAGTGTRCFSWKGGIGTSSRIVAIGRKRFTVGVLVQTNYGGTLSILGAPVGERLGASDFKEFLKPDGSCMIVLATDAPFSARDLKRIAKRAFFGMIRTGSIASHGSGDYAIAFSTDRSGQALPDEALNPFFLAAADATEEAIYDALFAAETMKGRGGAVLEALPKERVLAMLTESLHEHE